MVTIYYEPYNFNIDALADGEVEQWANDLDIYVNDTNSFGFTISNVACMTAVRALIAEGKYDHDNIQFVVDGKIVKVNEYGELEHHKYLDVDFDFTMRIVKAKIEKRKMKKEERENV